LGCGANLRSLTRLRCGLFDIRDAVSVSQLDDAFHHGYWQRFIYPIDTVLLHWAAMLVSDDVGRVIRNGCSLALESGDDSLEQETPSLSSAENRCRVYTDDGRFLGVLRFNPERRQWQPEKVFSTVL
jgi:tRNA U55 pseudouridine synthase TruB